MNKWMGIAIVVLLVVASGYFFSRDTAEPKDASASGPVAVVDEAPTPATGNGAVAQQGSEDCPVPQRAGSGSNQAGLLVTFGDGTSSSVCVSFDEDSINGYQLLESSGLSLVAEDYGSLGQAVCKISDGSQSDGCDYPSEECFCDSPPNAWVFFVPDSGQTSWSVSGTGISSTMAGNGGVQAQLWGDDKQVPPSCFYEEICG